MSTDAAPNASPAATPAPQNQAASPPPPTADWTKPPVGHPDGPPPPKLVSLPSDYFGEMQAKLARLSQIEQQRAAEIEAAQAKENELLAAKGQVEQAFEAERTTWRAKLQQEQDQLKAIRESFYGEKINAELNGGLNGVQFAGENDEARAEAARMFAASIRDRLEVIQNQDGTTVVVEKASRRPAAELIRERLSDPKLAFFLASNSRGGSGTDGTRPPANAQQPGSYAERVIAQWNANKVDDMSLGLHPKN